MKSLALVAVTLALGACRSHGDGPLSKARMAGRFGAIPKPEVTPAYRQDIATLCDVVHLSKADQLPEGQRAPTIAMYLGPHLKTTQAHDFLVAIQPLTGEPKAKALDDEAHRVGLPGCALSAAWR